MKQKLEKVYGLSVKNSTVLELIKILDPDGVAGRRRRGLRRRLYKNFGPNYVWHVDGHNKLNRFGFHIHGCIDGFSRKVLWLNVGTSNKDPRFVLNHYLKTVKKLKNIPTLLRSDRGTENSLIGPIHQALRYIHNDELSGLRSYLVGKSTHNQRIESFWVEIQRLATAHYKELFNPSVEDRILDVKNPMHIEILRLCFGPLIQFDLYIARKTWNEQRVRKQRQ